MATAYDAIYHSVARNLLDREEKKPRDRQTDLVNLMNVSAIGLVDEKEMRRLIEELGSRTQIFPCGVHPDDFINATTAALSVSTCPTHDDYFVKHLKEEYGVPYTLQYMPIGVKNTGLWLREIAKQFGKEDVANTIIQREESLILEDLKPFLPMLKGKKAMISAGEVRALSLAVLLQELGMKIVAVRPYHFDEFGEITLDQVLSNQINEPIINVATVHVYEAFNIVSKTKPDIYFGHPSDSVWAAKTGIPTIPISHGSYSYVGYSGVFEVARRTWRALTNPSFNQLLSKHVRLPFKKINLS